MRILLLNQYAPPDPAPTAILFGELAERLRERGHEVEFISSATEYRGAERGRGRLYREASALLAILRRGLFARRPDVVISGSSPPCLLVVATMVSIRHGAKHLHWGMDLYPELAVALGELAPSRVAGAIQVWMHFCYRMCHRVVVLDEDMAAQIADSRAHTEIIRPWLSQRMLTHLREQDFSKPSPAEPWVWIYSGNLGRAHEWETLLKVQAALEAEGLPLTLRFQGGGASWVPAQETAAKMGLRRCEWRPYADEKDLPAVLLECHATVVTQRPEARGLLWPSKLNLLLALPRPLLWVGPDGAIARMLRAIPSAGVFQPGDVEGIASWLRGNLEGPSARACSPADPAVQRTSALDTWERLLP